MNFGHKADSCTFTPTCHLCNGSHMALVCAKRMVRSTSTTNQYQFQSNQSSTASVDVNCCFKGSTPTRVFLQTVSLNLQGPKGTRNIRALLDSGSECSFIDSALASDLGLKPRSHPIISLNSFGGSDTGPIKSDLFQLLIRSTLDSSICLTVDVLGTDKITQKTRPSPTPIELSKYPHLNGLQFSDQSQGPIQMLLGADYYSTIVHDQLVRGPPGSPTAMNTAFGWVLSGPSPFSNPDSNHSVYLVENFF